MYKVIRAFWLLSLLGFMVLFLMTYANIEQTVRLRFSETGRFFTMSRDVFFYVVVGFFLLINLTLYVFARILRQLPKPQPSQNLWLADMHLRQNLINWLISLALILNIVIIFAIVLIGNMSDTFASRAITLEAWAYVTGGLISCWILALIFIFLRR